MNIELLPEKFTGKGEVANMLFSLHSSNEFYTIYKVECNNSTHYELFKNIYTAKCLDFAKRIYSEKEFKQKYPKSNDFGKTAWTFRNLDIAILEFEKLSQDAEKIDKSGNKN